MTAEELIIGHYEKSLTSEQESRLASMVDASPDVRTLYEQHGNIQALMIEEAETIETSSKLDKIVLGAALGTIAEIAGHGIGFSLLGKVASVVGVLAVGGAGFVLYNSMTGDDVTTRPQPAVRTSPSTSTPIDPSRTTEQAGGQTPDAASSTDASSTGVPSSTDRVRGAAASSARSSRNGGVGRSDDTPAAAQRPPLTLDPSDPGATIKHDPKTQAGDRKTPPDSGK